MIPTRKEIQRQIGLLRFFKALGILNAEGQEEKAHVFFQNSIIDLLLLPLYYAWVHFKLGTLQELRIESYLYELYHSFILQVRHMLPDYIHLLKVSNLPMFKDGNGKVQQSLLQTYINIEDSL